MQLHQSYLQFSIFSLRAGSSWGEKVGKEKGRKGLAASLRMPNDAPKKPRWSGAKKSVNELMNAHRITKADYNWITSPCQLINLSRSVRGRTESKVKAVRVGFSSTFLSFILTTRRACSQAIQYCDISRHNRHLRVYWLLLLFDSSLILGDDLTESNDRSQVQDFNCLFPEAAHTM